MSETLGQSKVFNQYFGVFSRASTRPVDRRADVYREEYDRQVAKVIHATHRMDADNLVLEFMLLADEYLNSKNPLTKSEYMEVCSNIAESKIEQLNDIVTSLENHKAWPLANDCDEFLQPMNPSATFQDLVNIKAPQGIVNLLREDHEREVAIMLKETTVLEAQIEAYLLWRNSGDYKKFFNAYQFLRVYEVNHGGRQYQKQRLVHG